MKRSFVILLISVFCAAFASAEGSNAQKKQWLDEMRQLRINFIAKELDLSKEQREHFAPVYDAMSKELEKTMRETRALYNSVKKKGAAATNIEKEKAAEAMYECKGKENAIEMRYFAKFKSILNTDQLFMLKSAEHKFNRQLMKQRRAKERK